MKHILFSIFILICSLRESFAHEYSLLDYNEKKLSQMDYSGVSQNALWIETGKKDYKSPGITFLISFLLPGLIIHGSGHMYMGEIGTGYIILGTEIIAAGLLIYEIKRIHKVCGLGTFDECEKFESSEKPLLEFGFYSLFLGGWIFDMARSTYLAYKEKVMKKEQKKVDIGLNITRKENGIEFVFRF